MMATHVASLMHVRVGTHDLRRRHAGPGAAGVALLVDVGIALLAKARRVLWEGT